jgi:hypothetical protein
MAETDTTVDTSTVDGLKAMLVRAFELGDAQTVRRDQYGDIAVEEGRYGRRSGDVLLDSGKYVSVFHRQPDGAWRWATDMWNSDAG